MIVFILIICVDLYDFIRGALQFSQTTNINVQLNNRQWRKLEGCRLVVNPFNYSISPARPEGLISCVIISPHKRPSHKWTSGGKAIQLHLPPWIISPAGFSNTWKGQNPLLSVIPKVLLDYLQPMILNPIPSHPNPSIPSTYSCEDDLSIKDLI